MDKISILTQPTRSLKEQIKYFYHSHKNMGNYGGPESVVRSLILGLKRLGVDYNYNPMNVKDFGKIVIVLSNVKALEQAIALKRQGRIKILLAGPNLMVFSTEYDSILSSEEINVCLVPSKNVGTTYVNDSPKLKDRVRIWYAGVDENYWNPKNIKNTSRNVLVYYKNSSQKLLKQVENVLREHGWDITKLVYGRYTQDNYRELLKLSNFAVFLSKSESQGIALAESWAMNTPTIVWNPGQIKISGRLFTDVSSAPYLSRSTGAMWRTIDEFSIILADVDKYLGETKSRKWVLENMTDVVSAKKLLSIIKSIK